MQGRRTAFSGQALCPGKYETGYFDREISSSGTELKKRGR